MGEGRNLGDIVQGAARLIRRSVFSRPFAMLLLVDCLLIGVHLFIATAPWEQDWPGSDWLRVDRDHSIAEMFEYANLFAAAAVLWSLIWRRRILRLAPAGFALIYMIADDAFELHEKVGKRLAPGRRVLGELSFFLICGAVLFGWGMFNFLRGGREDRMALLTIGTVIAGIAAFGVGLDALHGALISAQTGLKGIFTLIEDSGELVGISLLLAVVLELRAPADHGSRSAALL